MTPPKEDQNGKKRRRVGRPSLPTKKKSRVDIKHRSKYSPTDMMEAVRLVKEEGFPIATAAKHINDVKVKKVPRQTLDGWLRREDPYVEPPLGRPQELPKAVEEALVKCLVMCADFNYPMRKVDLQDLVQSYCIENEVHTSWKDDRPGKHWVRHFRKRWSHKVKIRKPTCIKRSRAKVSPTMVKEFFERIQPNLEDVPRHNIFNYDETGFSDNPGAEEAFFGAGSKYFEVIQDHSKTNISVMFCVTAAGDMLPVMVVYKSSTACVYPAWMQGGPDGTRHRINII
jgi:hypothetical protein